MPSIDRPLSGEVLVFDVEEERERAADPSLLERSGRNARTLIKTGPLRVVLVAMGAGGEIPEHQADGPITVQPVQGRIRFSVGDRDYDLEPGQVLSVGARVRHRVSSDAGGSFLLTVAQASGSEGEPGA